MTLARLARFVVGMKLLCFVGTLTAQTEPFSAPPLSELRRAAALIPGDAPLAINVMTLNSFRIPLSYMVEGGSAESVEGDNPAFQIRFSRGWIMVDAALDHELVPKSTTFSDAHYATIQQALRDARLVVVTHEHEDHVAGVIRSPYLAAVQQHTLLTRAQVQSLLTKANNPLIKLDSATAARYLVLDYASYFPIAPGVVLIKAPGHTPGSQMVYVRLASGREVVLAGDVAWHTSGVTTLRQKPDSSTRDFGGEDRAAIAQELRWLKDLTTSNVTVVISHDQATIDQLTARGVLHDGFDLKNK
jgi:glyoxylase-like metal-dependent hydrolase (beta-lactamase superfamily II)